MTLLAGAVAWLLAALVVAAGFDARLALPAALALAVLLPAPGFRYRGMHVAAAALAVTVAFMHIPTGIQLPSQTSVAHEIGTQVRLIVRADEDGDVHPSYASTSATASAVQIGGNWQPASGKIELLLPATADVRAGDQVEVAGRIEPPGGVKAAAGYRDWLSRRGIVASLAFPRLRVTQPAHPSIPTQAWRAFEQHEQNGLITTLPLREATLASSLLFGNHHALPKDLDTDLRNSGTSHVVVVSAFNVILLYGTLLALLAPYLGRRRAIILALVAALAYGTAAGHSAAVMRGEILTGLFALASLTGRPYSRIALLILAAAGMTVANASLLTDPSFQLTFAATAGIAILAPALRRLAAPALEQYQAREGLHPALDAILDAALISAAVSIASLPVLVYAFGSLPSYASLANALINPILPALTGLALLVGAIGGAVPVAGPLVAAPLWLLLVVTERVVHVAASAPGAQVYLNVPALPFALAWYATLGLVLPSLWLWQRRGRRAQAQTGRVRRDSRRRARRGVFTAGGAALLALMITPVLADALRAHYDRPRGPVVYWLDVASQPALLIHGGNGVQVLVANDTAPDAVIAALEAISPGRRGVDAVIVPRPTSGAGAGTGLSRLAARTGAGSLLYGGIAGGANAAPELPASPKHASENTARLVPVPEKSIIDLGGGDNIEVYGDSGGAVVRVTLSGQAILVGNALAEQHVVQRWNDVAAQALALDAGASLASAQQLEQQLHPSTILLAGHSSVDGVDVAATFPASTRIIPLVRVHDLRVTPRAGQLVVSYRGQ